ncbi:uncharacterized protein N7518_005528 [Penicillium psychrosexuale]|uniref:uncharacterized protein n=1 Tax=Penicillium psychrosexuale TaxID=1002107 RepID=UPI0025455296|nr:uncharacterized protein N7518_005528 [Penicillium psychrosexuale]KAJ5796988.1 hypothetical protein N7518_005528 [Penicillium psychrosexuale]
MPESLVSIGPWLVQLFRDVFFQPDDAVSSQAFDHGVSRDLAVRLNGQNLTFDEFRHAVEDTRAKNYIYEQSNDELLRVEADPRAGGGSVAQLSRFTLKDKSTGHETYSSTVILATIEFVEGRRVLTQLTEVSK